MYLGSMNDPWTENVKTRYSMLVKHINPEALLPHLRECLSTSDIEEVRCDQNRNGRRSAALTLLINLERRPEPDKVYHAFITALTDGDIGLQEVARQIDPILTDNILNQEDPTRGQDPQPSVTEPAPQINNITNNYIQMGETNQVIHDSTGAAQHDDCPGPDSDPELVHVYDVVEMSDPSVHAHANVHATPPDPTAVIQEECGPPGRPLVSLVVGNEDKSPRVALARQCTEDMNEGGTLEEQDDTHPMKVCTSVPAMANTIPKGRSDAGETSPYSLGSFNTIPEKTVPVLSGTCSPSATVTTHNTRTNTRQRVSSTDSSFCLPDSCSSTNDATNVLALNGDRAQLGNSMDEGDISCDGSTCTCTCISGGTEEAVESAVHIELDIAPVKRIEASEITKPRTETETVVQNVHIPDIPAGDSYAGLLKKVGVAALCHFLDHSRKNHYPFFD